MSKLLLLNADNQYTEMEEAPYPSEDALQKMLSDNPNLLTTNTTNGNASFLLVSREFGIPDATNSSRWAIDHLYVDNDGIPTFLEAKRSGDERARREVVAQMIEYAANCSAYISSDDIRKKLKERLGGDENEHSTISKLTGTVDITPEEYWQRVEDNLILGRIRLIFAADRMGPDLRRMIEFLNAQMERAEVLGIELPRFTDGATEVLSPQVIGRETSRKQPGSRKKKDTDSFLKAVSDHINGNLSEIKANTEPTSVIVAGMSRPDVRYEILPGNNNYSLGVTLISGNVDQNRDNAELLRSVVEGFARKRDFDSYVGMWGKKRARASVHVPSATINPETGASKMFETFREFVECTWDTVTALPGGQ